MKITLFSNSMFHKKVLRLFIILLPTSRDDSNQADYNKFNSIPLLAIVFSVVVILSVLLGR